MKALTRMELPWVLALGMAIAPLQTARASDFELGALSTDQAAASGGAPGGATPSMVCVTQKSDLDRSLAPLLAKFQARSPTDYSATAPEIQAEVAAYLGPLIAYRRCMH